jgi:hypothetical protein
VCDVCRSLTHIYTACSGECLERHLKAEHEEAAKLDLMARVVQHQTAMNLTAADKWDRYAGHRQRVMDLIPRVPDGLACVFGAGSCSDIDLVELSACFKEIHLVDLDGEALERSRARQTQSVRDRIVPHGDLDLSGFLNQIDDWGESFPSNHVLGPLAVDAARKIIQGLGTSFHVTVSSSVLSQLVLPYQRSLVGSLAEWVSLDAALTGVHLTTLAGATHSGGRCCIVFDVLSASEAPGMLDLKNADSMDLQALVMREVDPDRMRPNPWNLVRQLGAPGLGSLFSSPRLTSPWLWDIETDHQLVYGLAFDRS